MPDLGLVVELQTASPGDRLHTRAWCKLDLFDPMRRLMCGYWRVLLRLPPMRPSLSTAEIGSLPQVTSGCTQTFQESKLCHVD